MGSAKEFYQSTPDLGKNIMIIGAGALAWSLLSSFQTARESKPHTEETKDQKDELEEIKTTVPATYADSQYKTWANSLEDYMFDAGTDKTGIVGIMNKLKNNTDFLKLNVAFGKRKYYTFGIDYGFKNLGQWLALEDGYWEYLVSDINDLLKKHGITYSF